MSVFVCKEEASISRSLTEFSLSNNDYDVTCVFVENKEIRCRTDVLVENSFYFKTLFSFQNRVHQKSKTNQVRLMGGINYESTRVILSGLECGNYELNADNAQGVLLASTFLQCHKSEVVAANYILANIVNSNAFSAFLLGINCGSSYLAESAELYILKNVETYEKKVRSVMDDVLQLEVSGLKILLEEICDNYMAYIVICGWTLYDVGNRSECLASLIADFVNVELISPDAILVDGLEDLSAIQDAHRVSLEYENLPLRDKVEFWDAKFSNQDFRKVLHRRWPKSVVAFAAQNTYPTMIYQCPTSNRWVKLTEKPASLEKKSAGCIGIVISFNLYFIGGYSNTQMWSFNISQGAWKLLSADQEERIAPQAVRVDHCIYVFGGYVKKGREEANYLDTAAKFDTVKGTWVSLSPMGSARGYGKACHVNGKIYLFGGLYCKRQAVNTCEVYEIATDRYSPLTNMPTMVYDFGLVHIEQYNTIYILGGVDPITLECQNKIHAYDIASNSWSSLNPIPPMILPRRSFGCFFDGSYIYSAGGGTTDYRKIYSIERYSPRIGRWEMVESFPRGFPTWTVAEIIDLPVRLMHNYKELAQSTVCCSEANKLSNDFEIDLFSFKTWSSNYHNKPTILKK